MYISPTILITSVCIIGYLLGRAGHFFHGHKIDFLHHWIYGLTSILIGILINFEVITLNLSLVSFGIGLMISDFNDFVNLKIYGRDTQPVRKFWGID